MTTIPQCTSRDDSHLNDGSFFASNYLDDDDDDDHDDHHIIITETTSSTDTETIILNNKDDDSERDNDNNNSHRHNQNNNEKCKEFNNEDDKYQHHEDVTLSCSSSCSSEATTNNDKKHDDNNDRNLKVCLIGCGPGGLSFLHALETKRRELKKKNDVTSLSKLPTVICYERQSSHGGVWNSSSKKKRNDDNGHNTTTMSTTTDIEATPSASTSTNMYDALWTNGAKENIEYFDYTYLEHFGPNKQLPVYMKRQQLLDYMTGRVTKHSPNIFKQYVQFNTSVVSVTYDETIKKFKVVVTINKDNNNNNNIGGKNNTTEEETILFDKCIWSCGENGTPKIPKSIMSIFYKKKSGCCGTNDKTIKILHSSQVSQTLKEDVYNKNILLIGGSYSAEDLTLMSIKLGVKHVYISFRSDNAVVTWAKHWPKNKVTLLSEQIPVSYSNNSNNTNARDNNINKNTINFKSVKWEYPNRYYVPDNTDISMSIHNIDTVIFCTGYNPNTSMLSKSLQPMTKGEMYQCKFIDDSDNDFNNTSFKKEWKMKINCCLYDSPNNTADDDDGEKIRQLVKSNDPVNSEDIPIKNDNLRWGLGYASKDLYRGIVLISNPNMYFLFAAKETSSPLLETDVNAWLLLQYILYPKDETILPPTPEQMANEQRQQFQDELNIIVLRYCIDKLYQQAWYRDVWDKYDYDKCEYVVDKFNTNKIITNYQKESAIYGMKLLARKAREGKYPVDFGTYDKLSNHSKQIVLYDDWVDYHKCNSYYANHHTNFNPYYNDYDLVTSATNKEEDDKHNVNDDDSSKGTEEEKELKSSSATSSSTSSWTDDEKTWKTFRDYSNGYMFKSLFTQTKASTTLAGSKKWLDIDEEEEKEKD